MDERHTFPTTFPGTLTTHQRAVIELIAEGLTNVEIGQRLGVTPGTAAKHVETILRRLGTGTRMEAAMWGVALGSPARRSARRATRARTA